MPGPGTEAVVDKLPYCDLHKAAGEFRIAEYDARTNPNSLGKGSWAYLCSHCFEQSSPGCLGTGVGQKLILSQRENG